MVGSIESATGFGFGSDLHIAQVEKGLDAKVLYYSTKMDFEASDGVWELTASRSRFSLDQFINSG